MLSSVKKTPKITFWEASKRPMFVKSVWVEDEGYRHFILNSDECQKKRSEYKASRKAQTMQNQVYDKMTKDLNDVSLSKTETPEANQQPNSQFLAVPNKHYRLLHKQHTVETDHYDPEANDDQPTTMKPEDSDGKIQLTERVLQWLDLAGKQTLIHNELNRMDQHKSAVSRDHAILRRVQTTESLMSMTSVRTLRPVQTTKPIPKIAVRRVSTTESLVNNGSLYAVRPNLQRSESLHQLSLTFDEVGEDLPELPPPEKFSGIRFDIFPATLRCSKKFLSCVHSRNTLSRSHSDVSTYSEATSVAPTVEEFSKRKRYPKHLLRKSSTLEQRYKSIINRHILETACNEQNLKRQLHIFLPKSRTANECESCLSTIISDVSKS